MYLAFYHLKKQPFNITPDPEFLYLSPSHKEALAAIIYGIEQRKGFIGIVGAVGVGKTTILRSYLEAADKNRLKLVYVFNADLTFEELLKTVYQELGLEIETAPVAEMVNRLYGFLIEEYNLGSTVVLVVDEAQNMPIDTLESLRMISNLETSKSKLIQIVLVAQQEFEETLNLDRLRQLKQRLAIRSKILPLTGEESAEYVRSRLQKAGSNVGSIFTPAALKTIIKRARGIPRVLNVLCDNALVTGFGYQQKPVTKKIVREIIRDFEGRGQVAFGRWTFPGVAALAVLFVAVAWFALFKEPVLTRLGTGSLQGQRAIMTGEIEKVRPKDRSVSENGDPQPIPTKERIEGPNPKRTMLTKTVIPGDTLSRLTEQVYGNPDGSVIKLVQESNPQITDPNVIRVGTKIDFPVLPGKASGQNE